MNARFSCLMHFFCSGKIIGKGFSVERNLPYLTIFVNDPIKSNYVKVYYNPTNSYDYTMCQNIRVVGKIISSIYSNEYYKNPNQYCFADTIEINKTVLSEVYSMNDLGFDYPKPFSKVYISGEVIDRYSTNNEKRKFLKIVDYKDQIITLQYTDRMRINDINFAIGDFVYSYATVLSRISYKDKEIKYHEYLLLEDIAIKN